MSENVIVGSDGLIGSALYKEILLKGDQPVTRLSRMSLKNTFSRNNIFFNLSDLKRATKLLNDAKKIFFCTGYSGHNYDSKEANDYFESERKLIYNLLHMEKQIVYFSSNKVELLLRSQPVTLPESLTCYLRHKLSIERLLSNFPNQTTFRLGKIIHHKYDRYTQWIQGVKSRCFIHLPKNVYYEPIDIRYAAREILSVSEQEIYGRHLIQASDSISYFESAFIVLQTYFGSDQYHSLIRSEMLAIPVPQTISPEHNLGSSPNNVVEVRSKDQIKLVVARMRDSRVITNRVL